MNWQTQLCYKLYACNMSEVVAVAAAVAVVAAVVVGSKVKIKPLHVAIRRSQQPQQVKQVNNK